MSTTIENQNSPLTSGEIRDCIDSKKSTPSPKPEWKDWPMHIPEKPLCLKHMLSGGRILLARKHSKGSDFRLVDDDGYLALMIVTSNHQGQKVFSFRDLTLEEKLFVSDVLSWGGINNVPQIFRKITKENNQIASFLPRGQEKVTA